MALAVYQQKLGRFDDAIHHAKKVTELAPEDAFSFTQLSVIYQRCGKIFEAEDANGASAYDPGNTTQALAYNTSGTSTTLCFWSNREPDRLDVFIAQHFRSANWNSLSRFHVNWSLSSLDAVQKLNHEITRAPAGTGPGCDSVLHVRLPSLVASRPRDR